MPIYGSTKGIIVPPAIAGRYYDGETVIPMSGISTTAAALTAVRHYAMLALLGVGVYTKLGIYVGTLASGKVARCAIYDVGSDGLPGNRLIDGGADLDVGSIGEKEHTINFPVTRPQYVYLTLNSDGTPSIAGYTNAARTPFGWPSGSGAAHQSCIFRDTTYGPPPAQFGAASFTSLAFPRIWVRAT